MNEVAKLFYEIGEPFAAGLFEEPERGYFYRYALASARYFENVRPAAYEAGDLLVGPTPDGRKEHAPTADSVSALRGKATAGPTAMLCSAAKLPQHLVDGICVLNLTLAKNNVEKAIKPLVEGYFAKGGIQVQVTAASAEELKDIRGLLGIVRMTLEPWPGGTGRFSAHGPSGLSNFQRMIRR